MDNYLKEETMRRLQLKDRDETGVNFVLLLLCNPQSCTNQRRRLKTREKVTMESVSQTVIHDEVLRFVGDTRQRRLGLSEIKFELT